MGEAVTLELKEQEQGFFHPRHRGKEHNKFSHNANKFEKTK